MTAPGRVSLDSIFLDTRKDLERAVRRRVRSREVTADLVHDLYMKCRATAVDFPDRKEARAYLLRMASNLAIDHERVEGRRSAILVDLAPIYEMFDKEAESPEAYLLAADKARQTEAALARLPKLTREVFVEVQLHGLTHKEAAARLGVSKSLVDKHILQALFHCRDAVAGHGADKS